MHADRCRYVQNLDITAMRKAGSILGEVLRQLTGNMIYPGVSTLDLSKKAEEIIRSYDGASPAFLGYRGFTAAACVSVNHEAVHGVPREDKHLQEGDIVSVDCGVEFNGHFSDACRTVGVGQIGQRQRKLIRATRDALGAGIAAAQPGNRIGDISYAVQRHVERRRFNVSREFVGHGIGRVLHGPPVVPNYGPPGRGGEIKPGICLAVEPVVFDGPPIARLLEDKWTVVSATSCLVAHAEDTVLITEEGPEILTR